MEQQQPRAGRALRALLVSLVSLVVTLGAVEAAARLFLKGKWHTPTLQAVLAGTNIRSLIELHPDPALLYRLRPHQEIEFQGSLVRTDATGKRVRGDEPPPAANGFTVVLLGDSTSFGWRVAYEESYGDLVRAGLERHLGRPVALHNLSVPGYNASQELALLERTFDELRPDLVLVHHDHNDAQPTGWGYGGWVPPEYGDNALGSAALKVVLRKIKERADRKAYEIDAGSTTIEGYTASGPDYDRMLAARAKLAERCRVAGVPVFAVLFNAAVVRSANWAELPIYSELHRGAEQHFSEQGYDVLDLYPLLQQWLVDEDQKDMSRLWFEPTDQHPTPEGHKLIAEMVLEHLVQRSPWAAAPGAR